MKEFDPKDCALTVGDGPLRIECLAMAEIEARVEKHRLPPGVVITFTISGDLKERINQAVNEYLLKNEIPFYTDEVIENIKAIVKACL